VFEQPKYLVRENGNTVGFAEFHQGDLCVSGHDDDPQIVGLVDNHVIGVEKVIDGCSDSSTSICQLFSGLRWSLVTSNRVAVAVRNV